MRVGLKVLLTFVALAPTALLTKASAAEAALVGTWRLVSWIEEETESKIQHKVFGENPAGSITYTADGRVMVIFIDPNRKPPSGPKAADNEAAQLYRTMVAYAGAYSLEGDKVTHKIEVSWNQIWNGTDQQRFFEIRDNRLMIKTPPFTSPFLGKQIVSTLIWERIK